MLKINGEAFEREVLENSKPVLVDFYADWCGPCKMVAPVLEELDSEYAGKAVFVKINVDDSQDLAMRYGVLSIPTLILFKDGNQVEKTVGFSGKPQLKSMIDKNL